MKDDKIFRLFDANINRSTEGLRVCEDIARFLYNNESLAKKLKRLRHKILDYFSKSNFDRKNLIDYRNVLKDKIKNFNIKDEFQRQSIEEVFFANIKRVEEALRVLEEMSKLKKLELSKNLKKIRFRIYKAEKEFSVLRKQK